MKVLLIAGHGKQRSGIFDPGASGFLRKGEHKYMSEDLFPAMKNYIPLGVTATFHTAYNVYSYGDLATLARGYDAVIEFHFDAAGNNTASGGHVIVYSGFKPDNLDLKLRDAIKNNVGINSVYRHYGQPGISGRNDLQNVNIAANSGVNYRLLELGFGTNKTDADYMIKNVDKYARDLVTAIFGSINSTKTKPPNKSATGGSGAKITGNFKIGDGVKFSGHVYRDSYGGGKGSQYTNRQAKITKINAAGTHPYHVDGLGWVAGSQLTKITAKPKTGTGGGAKPSYKSKSGTFKVTTPLGLNVRSAPEIKPGNIVTVYAQGQTVNILSTLISGGYEWGHYISYSGHKRYIALGVVNGPKYGQWV